jgi:hypothetical protein
MAHDFVVDLQVQGLLQQEEPLEEVLMHRWIAIVAVAAVALFAASFAMARSGRPQAEPSPPRTDSAPAALERVKTASGVGRLRRLEPRSLPALKREPVKPPDDDNGVSPPIVDDFPPITPPVDNPPVVPPTSDPPANDPPANDPPANDPPPGSGCDPCG